MIGVLLGINVLSLGLIGDCPPASTPDCPATFIPITTTVTVPWYDTNLQVSSNATVPCVTSDPEYGTPVSGHQAMVFDYEVYKQISSEYGNYFFVSPPPTPTYCPSCPASGSCTKSDVEQIENVPIGGYDAGPCTPDYTA